MSRRDYEEAVELIARHEQLADFDGPVSSALIELSERELGVAFPNSFRDFLGRYGVGGFGSSEIYGVVGEPRDDSSVPDLVWLTKDLRSTIGLRHDLVPIAASGAGEWICLDLSTRDAAGEASVVLVPNAAGGAVEFYADDFGDYLLGVVEDEAL